MPEKYKDEIEEILRKAGEAAPRHPPKASERQPEDRPREPVANPRLPAQETRTGPRVPTITPGKVMLAGVVLFLIGIKFTPLIWIGLAMLVGAYLLYFVKPRSITYEKRWRGRSVEDTPTDPLNKLKRWFKG